MSIENVNNSIFLPPERLEYPSAWTGHIPFAHWVIEQLRPELLVELGTHYGHSYFNFCRGVVATDSSCRCFAVDTWQGDVHAGDYKEDVYQGVAEYNAAHYESFSTLCRMTFDEALEKFEDGSVDLLHIDGCHTYEAVRHDFESWLPKLKPYALVLFHDTQVRENNFGVYRFWEELCEKYELHLEFTHSYGLGVLQVGKGEREFPWLIPGSEEQEEMLSLFEKLGNLVDKEKELYQRSQHLEMQESNFRTQLASGEEVKRLQSDIVKAQAEIDHLQQCHETSLIEQEKFRAYIQLLEKKNGSLTAQLGQSKIMAEELCRYYDSAFRPYTRQIGALEQSHPRPMALLAAAPKSLFWLLTGNFKRRWEYHQKQKALMESGYFDPVWYLNTNRDVAGLAMSPAEHWLLSGWKEGRSPSPHFDLDAYLKAYPEVAASDENPVAHYLRVVKPKGGELPVSRPKLPPANQEATPEEAAVNVREIFKRVYPWDNPLPVREAHDADPGISIVTDSIGRGTLFGGVGTAIILGVLLAKRSGKALRIVTLNEEPDISRMREFLDGHNIQWDGELSAMLAREEACTVMAHPDELFITTSWWSTMQTRHSVLPENILYLLQEDERMFYNQGDERLRCSEVMSDPDMRFVLNTNLLREHLLQSGFSNLERNSRSFEPSFSPKFYYHEPATPGARKKFFFYARPSHPRNLFHRGLEAVERALESGLLDPNEWELIFVGNNLPDIRLPRGVRPTLLQNVPWHEYAACVREIDLGLSLMYTPHPSYPPLDLAACGAVVVTNRFGVKDSLESYSENILCEDLSVDGIVGGLRKALELLATPEEVSARAERDGILRDWNRSLDAVIDWVLGD